jgi:hypothetical protein
MSSVGVTVNGSLNSWDQLTRETSANTSGLETRVAEF